MFERFRRKSRDRFDLFFHFFSRHLAIIAIIAAVGIPLYAAIINGVRKNEVGTRSEQLNQFRDYLESELREIDEWVFDLSWSSEMTRLLALDRIDYGANDLYRTLELNRYLSNRLTSNSLVHDIAVYYRSSEILVTTSTIVLRMPYYYGSLFELKGIDYETWMNQFLGNSSFAIHDSFALAADRTLELPLIMYGRRISQGENRDATIIVMLDERRISQMFSAAGITDEGRYQILSRTGAVLSESDYSHPENGSDSLEVIDRQFEGSQVSREDVITLEVTLRTRNWHIRVDVPQKEILASFWSTGSGVSIAIAAAFMLGLISSVLFAYQASNPIRRILNRVHSAVGENVGEGKGGIALVEREMSALLEHDQNIGRRLQEQRFALRAVYLDRLLKGQVDREEIRTVSSMVGLDFRTGQFVVAVLSLNRDPAFFPPQEDPSWEGLALLVRDRILRKRRGVADAQALTRSRIAVFMSIRGAGSHFEYEQVQTELHELVSELSQELRVNIVAGVGVIATSPYDIWRSYQTAVRAIDDGGPLSYDSMVQIAAEMEPASGYYYPLEREIELVKLTRAGESEDVEEALAAIIRENRYRNIEVREEIALVEEIRATIHKIAAPLSIERSLVEIPRQPETSLNWDTLRDDLFRIFLEICAVVNRRKNSHNRNLADRIKHFINSNFADPNLSLGLVASAFSLSESYVSHFFVEQTGDQYSKYVERVRMAHATQMLEQTASRVEEIAYAVGYTSVHGFRRAFKRAVGSNPLDIRKSARMLGTSGESIGIKPASF